MTDRKMKGASFDLDAAFAALERDERAARPKPDARLVERVLADAAGLVAGGAAAAAAVPEGRAASGWRGWLGLFGFGDAWAGAATAAVVLCLAIGFGIGYEADPEILSSVGMDRMLGGGEVMLADAGGDFLDGEDVL